MRRSLFGRPWHHAAVVLFVCVSACRTTDPFSSDGTAALYTTRPPSNSAIFVAKTDSGVVMIDLGWSGRSQDLVSALDRIQARPVDVRRVFLTHSHRDHVALWPWLEQARFHLAQPELPFFLGQDEHRDTGSRVAERLHSADYPKEGRLKIEAFGGDTVFALGADTVWAFDVPGHTLGSAAFVLRGTAFLGDAVSDDIRGNLESPVGFFSIDVEQGRRSIQRFIAEVDRRGLAVVRACSAHATCVSFEDLRAEFEEVIPGAVSRYQFNRFR